MKQVFITYFLGMTELVRSQGLLKNYIHSAKNQIKRAKQATIEHKPSKVLVRATEIKLFKLKQPI
jgi:hypothetical protein